MPSAYYWAKFDDRGGDMKAYMKKILVSLVLMMMVLSSLAAATDVVTLHLYATVPSRASVSVDDSVVRASVNSSDVSFDVYDLDGQLVASNSSFPAQAGSYRLSFSAV